MNHGAGRPVELDAFSSPSHVNAVIETPKGSRINYKYVEESGLFKLHRWGCVPLAASAFSPQPGVLTATRSTCWCSSKKAMELTGYS
jgi:hypothetical protein